jgi:hypothetical protein
MEILHGADYTELLLPVFVESSTPWPWAGDIPEELEDITKEYRAEELKKYTYGIPPHDTVTEPPHDEQPQSVPVLNPNSQEKPNE